MLACTWFPFLQRRHGAGPTTYGRHDPWGVGAALARYHRARRFGLHVAAPLHPTMSRAQLVPNMQLALRSGLTQVAARVGACRWDVVAPLARSVAVRVFRPCSCVPTALGVVCRWHHDHAPARPPPPAHTHTSSATLVARSECMGFRARIRVGLQAFGGALPSSRAEMTAGER